ncbi:hypothetical protein LOTGIDRAFT_157363 [Lottia gigantea]|uniref:Beta-lactamase-related domain-containing protein n=1 Tax=Lottia gigantea TaxID=225164 RepID=V4CJ26_LOTGI|nr:hypothetical protein LOTGIDRAFT_157363 [Lottia gigantea]ESP02205.1 hypothetical protein LOTGIDRAFT_157363 [Lottia gigantea]
MGLLVLLAFCLVSQSTPFATAFKISEADVKAFVNSVLKCYNISGLSLAMVSNTQTVFTGGFGVKTYEKGDPVDSQTLFNVGSVTKSFTATIAADAVSREKIQWDQPLQDTFKDLKLSDDFRTAKATLRDLLGHKMCVPEYWGDTTVAENITRQEMIKRLEFYENICDLRTQYRYSNQMVVSAAAAVEIATCQYWEDAIFDKIYKPLGMSKSNIASRMTDADWDNTAFSYTRIGGKPVANPEKEQAIMFDNQGPAGGVYSNAEDMAKYLRFHLNNGKVIDTFFLKEKPLSLMDQNELALKDESDHQVISAKELIETHEPNYRTSYEPYTTDIYPVQSSIDEYGMGWRTGYYRGHKKVEHTGSYSSYTCRNTFLPDAGVGVWVCEASGFDGYTANQVVSWFALDLLLGEKPWLTNVTACTFPAPWVKPEIKKPTTSPPTTTTSKFQQPNCGVNFTEYAGDYYNKAFGTFRVWINSADHLVCSSGRLLNCSLMLIDCNNRFNLFISGTLEYRDPTKEGFITQFSDFVKDSGYQSVALSYFDGSHPPLFQRGKQHKPVDYPAGRGPLSGICKKTIHRRDAKTTEASQPSTGNPMKGLMMPIYGLVTCILLYLFN